MAFVHQRLLILIPA
jgi:hypothetical protein